MTRNRILVWGFSNNKAGTEMVIYNYAKHLPSVAFDFLCYEKPSNYSDLFAEPYHNRYFLIPIKIQHPIAYMQALRKFMHEHGNEYHTLWFNINDISNIDLLIYAKRYGINRRITHIHNSRVPNVFITKCFSRLNWKKCLRLTTDRWACSESAGTFLYRELPYSVIPNLIDVQARRFDERKRIKIRSEWGLSDSWVIGTVGRLADQKNHKFLIRLMPKILEANPSAKLLIVGEGPLREKLALLARSLNVDKQVIFAGSQSDIQGFLSAFDMYVFPSLYEGLSLSILEAQYNGLPCVISEGVGEESIISLDTKVIELSNTAGWISGVLRARRKDAERTLISDRASVYDLANIDSLVGKMFVD